MKFAELKKILIRLYVFYIKKHLDKIDGREKYNEKIIKQDRKLIQEVGQGKLKTMKDDINEISSEETIKLPEFKPEEFKVEKD